MCETCGCGKPGEFKINDPHHENGEMVNWRNGENDDNHHHEHHHDHHHDHGHHHHENGEMVNWRNGEKGFRDKKEIPLNIDILSENNRLAERNRGYFEAKNVLCLNLVSSPGSGKTSILEKTIQALLPAKKLSVIEGDQQTTRDADRIKGAGAPAIQINTGSGCHLDANMISQAVKKMNVENSSILFIENVGNLVCPALFDLGEKKRVVVISVTEGDDKPLKYPYMFQSSDLCIINKTDLLPYVDFRVETAREYALRFNPKLEFILMSAKTGEGLDQWYEWLEKQFSS